MPALLCLSRSLRLHGACAVMLMFGASAVNAANWTVRPRITVGATYTDNVSLDRGSQANDATILQVTPGISMRHAGVLGSMNLDYNLQGVTYLGDGDRTDINHQLQFSSGTQLIREHLFLDLSASVFQALVDSKLPYARSSLNLVGNQTDVAQIQVSPSYRYRFGAFALFNARYGFNESFVHRQGFGQQQGHNASVSLASGPSFDRVTWSLDYNYRRNDAESVATNREFETAKASMSLAVSQWLRLNGSAGREINSFTSYRSSGSATTWSGGLTWMPSRRTTVSASIGNRAYGRSYSLDLSRSEEHTSELQSQR